MILLLLAACAGSPEGQDAPDDTDTAVPTDADGARPVDEAPCAMAARVPPVLALGTGWEGFEPLGEDPVLEIVRGPQGGYHVFGSFRAHGVLPGPEAAPWEATNPLVGFLLLDGERTQLAGYPAGRRALEQGPGGSFELVGELLILAVSTPEEADGRVLTMRATVLDRCGRSLEAEAPVRLSWTPPE